MTTPSRVGKSTFTNPSDTELVMTRLFDAPRKLVFEAWTNPKHLPHWMLGPDGWTMPVCEVDLRPGGAWHFVWRRADGTEMSMRGVYKEARDAAAATGMRQGMELSNGRLERYLNTLA